MALMLPVLYLVKWTFRLFGMDESQAERVTVAVVAGVWAGTLAGLVVGSFAVLSVAVVLRNLLGMDVWSGTLRIVLFSIWFGLFPVCGWIVLTRWYLNMED